MLSENPGIQNWRHTLSLYYRQTFVSEIFMLCFSCLVECRGGSSSRLDRLDLWSSTGTWADGRDTPVFSSRPCSTCTALMPRRWICWIASGDQLGRVILEVGPPNLEMTYANPGCWTWMVEVTPQKRNLLLKWSCGWFNLDKSLLKAARGCMGLLIQGWHSHSSGWWFQTFGLFSIIYGMSSFPLTVIFFKMGTLHQFAPPTSHNHHRPQSWYKFRCTNAFLDISGSVRNCSNPELFAVDRTRFFGSPRTGQFFFTQKFMWYTGYIIKIAASNCPFFS